MYWGKISILVQVFFTLFFLASPYRLNVPRVLLPYHPNIQVSFELIVTDPEGGCFRWKSTRSDVVAVKISGGDSGCSDRAVIYATSKHESEQTAMVFAEEKDSGVVLSCGVAVDIIRNIVISTTTKVLFLDAGPSHMVIHALNSEGDMFSNLGGIPFEWELQSTSSKRPLRVVPFAQSKYEAPDGVRHLEEKKKRGYVVLVEGVQTGTATLVAKLSESFFEVTVPSQEIVLLVVANLLLVPSCDLYLPIGSVVRYSAQIVKQGSTEQFLSAVSLPSKQYQLEVADSSICSLNEGSASITAISLGATEVSLVDKSKFFKKLRKKKCFLATWANVALKPPSVHIYVVEPLTILFAISGEVWFLEVGRRYTITVQAYDLKDNSLFIADNAVFNTKIPKEFFEVITSSENDTYFEVEAVKFGVARLRSEFVSVKNPDGSENKLGSVMPVEQLATISEPVMIVPAVVIFPYISNEVRHSLQLKAVGGTGFFSWSTEDNDIARVNATGFVTSYFSGETVVRVRDMRNPQHFATAVVKVLPPAKISFAESALEAVVSTFLLCGKLLPVASCEQASFLTSVSESSVFELIEGRQQVLGPTINACATLSLRALNSGDTTVNVTFGKHSAVAYISAFNKLKLKLAEEVLLTPGSELVVTYSGGPRPWILDPSNAFLAVEYSNSVNLVRHKYVDKQLHLLCNEGVGDILVRLRVGNHRTQTNSLPATSVAELRVCCAVPSRIEIGVERSSARKEEKCPKTSPVIYTKNSSVLFLKGYGVCASGPSMGQERQFDSISSLLPLWSVDDESLLNIDGFVGDGLPEKLFAIVRPRGLSGSCTIKAKIDSFLSNGKKHSLSSQLSGTLEFLLRGRAKVEPNEVVLWNEKSNTRKYEITAGSGHFDLVVGYDVTVISVAVNRKDIEMEVSSEVSLEINVEGTERVVFTPDDVATMDVKIGYLSDVLSLLRIDPLNYRLIGRGVGTSTLKASARSARGDVIYSPPHDIHIFAPLTILPKLVTLIPSSVFQFELVGGPQPNPPVKFSLNDSSVALVNSDGLITSKNLGWTSVTGSLNIDSNFSKDYAVVKVVSLVGVRILVSSLTLDQGGKAWARVEGLGNDENPFSFCGALYPLTITWSLGGHGIIELTSPLGGSVSELTSNYFQVSIKALTAGQTELKVVVVTHPDAPTFTSRSKTFEDRVIITVNDPLKFVQPELRPTSIVISPESKLELEVNRLVLPNGSVAFAVPQQFKGVLSVSNSDRPILYGRDVGEAVLEVRESSTLTNRTIFVGVSVVISHSVFLKLNNLIPVSGDGQALSSLPLGFHIRVSAGSRDQFGRLLQANGLKLQFRPHRFDLTEITKTGQQTIEVILKRIGETTVMVWDERNPTLNAFLRIPVASVITPSFKPVLTFDVICFKSVLLNPSWTELSSRKRFTFIDRLAGIVVARETGTAVMGATFPNNQTTYAEISVIEPEEIVFGDVPPFVTNAGRQQFLFPVFLKRGTTFSNVHDCDAQNIEKLSELKAPFDCVVYFEKDSSVSAQKLFFTRSIFSSVSNSYACLVEKMSVESNSNFMKDVEGTLVIKAVLSVFGKDYKAESETRFYPSFEVEEKELRFDNLRSEGTVIIRAANSIKPSISVEACTEDVLLIKKRKSAVTQNLIYDVKLNINSALLWEEYLKTCNLTIKSALTGQTEEVPIRILLGSDASKEIKFAWYKGYSIIPALFAPGYKLQPGVTGYGSPSRFSRQSLYTNQDPYNLASARRDFSRHSSFNRSAGSAGDAILWGRDTSNSPLKSRG
ncbi:unnamed protein product [Enterobius vermicularis]|uniref:BIG2 domain-containing protein n=1 Tax=Enterobius vermicularis TaxID=51028 RepID=A0A0N4V790_ENTVE|nr:unnamed protein product [Enterobius vermicularis]